MAVVHASNLCKSHCNITRMVNACDECMFTAGAMNGITKNFQILADVLGSFKEVGSAAATAEPAPKACLLLSFSGVHQEAQAARACIYEQHLSALLLDAYLQQCLLHRNNDQRQSSTLSQ